MLEIFEGPPGNGKSLSAVLRIISHVCKGGTVYTNLALRLENWPEYIARTYGLEMHPDQLRLIEDEQILELWKYTAPGTAECPVLLVLDEIQDQLNAKDHSDKTKRPLFQWLCQHRHDDNDLIMISQSLSNIDAQCRRNAECIWSFVNMRQNFRIMGLGCWPFPQILQRRWSKDGRTLLERNFWWIQPAVFELYHSKAKRLSRKRSEMPVERRHLKRIQGPKPNWRKHVTIRRALTGISLGILLDQLIGRM
jgi:zona occludens toxin (predicted ATPase)